MQAYVLLKKSVFASDNQAERCDECHGQPNPLMLDANGVMSADAVMRSGSMPR